MHRLLKTGLHSLKALKRMKRERVSWLLVGRQVHVESGTCWQILGAPMTAESASVVKFRAKPSLLVSDSIKLERFWY
jgi:hypothetical protein